LREGKTYELLHKASVSNLAVCSAAGDISNHTTVTHHFQNKTWACKTACEMVPHHHYWLVMDTIGLNLTNFLSSYIMLSSVRDAANCMHFLFVCSGQLLILVFLGHKDAVAAGVLHHDVSTGNFLIVGK
jgi:hypothetical protein